jgi:NADPH:quinone reductase-like Zn-dependent oxidoreductase
MLAAYADAQYPDDPLSGLVVGDRPVPEAKDGWVTVDVKAASLNHHDLWSLRGVGLSPDKLPMILGGDAAGVTADGREVVVHSLVGDPTFEGDETLDPKRTLLSELHQGTLAEQVTVPARNLVAKPASLSFEEAACLPTAWLTAYRMLITQSGLKAGDDVLIQGAGGGVATAAITIARAAGFQVHVTSRDEGKRAKALELGAHAVYETGARLPVKVDAVMETVGKATWSHSLRALRPGGTVVVCGATSGGDPTADLNRVFFLQLRVVGSTMGTRSELEGLLSLLAASGARPLIDSVVPLSEARQAFEKMHTGDVFGKIVLTP